ncbi:MAG: two-component system, NarL family, response regulator DegU [Actinomycetota bacterium]
MSDRVRLLLADDHTMLRQSLRRTMEDEGLEVVGEAGDGEEAARLAEELTPDVVLMDVSMPVLDGVEATRLITERNPDVAVVMLTMHADADVVARAIKAGAVGYLVKDCTTEELVRTIRQAASGETALSPDIAASMLEQMRTASEPPRQESVLSPREEEVLQRIAEGASTTEVAEQLYISVKTVKNHLASIYEKLDARDRTQAVLQAVRMGIVRLR